MSLRTKGKPEKANGANNTESSLVSGEFSPVSMDIERPHSEDQRPDSPMYMQKERSEERELNSDRKNGRGQTLQQTENRRVIIITHINIFLYATCFWIQNGTLPYLSKKLGADPIVFGYLQTTFAVVQLAGGPLFGRFGDIFGGRKAMMLAFLAASLSYSLLGMSYSLPILFLSRIPSVFMHAMQGGQMIVTDIGDLNHRADALGKLGMSYGVGMVIGPFIGGLINKRFGEQFAAFVAAAGSLLSIYLVFQFVPHQTKKTAAINKDTPASTSIFSVKKLTSLFMAPGALFLLIIRLISGIPIGVFQSMFQVVALETFKLEPDQNGYLMSYIGVTTMIVQGVGIGIITKKFTESSTLVASSFLLVWAYFFQAYVTTVWQLCAVCLPLVVGLTTQNIVITSALTHTVSMEDTGAMLGLNMAVNSLVRTVSPTIGGYLLGNYGFPSFGYLGAIISSFVTFVLFVRHRNKITN